MYLKLTTRCNMSCKHCGMAATSKGKDMPKRIWKQAIKVAIDRGNSISLGGGEPTLHKEFWEIMVACLSHCGTMDDASIWLATNGSQTETSLALAQLAKQGAIGCALSQDKWHDKIDDRVVKAFTKYEEASRGFGGRYPNDYREIRNVSNNLIKTGRCEDGKEGCMCEDIVVDPDGKIRGCGCKSAPQFGKVFAPAIPDDYEIGECSLKKE